MYDIITMGSSSTDVFVKTEAKNKSSFMCYPIGEKILIEDIKFFTGGGGTNSAVAFSKMGFKTAYLGKVGNDNNANTIINELKKEKVDFIGKKSKGVTGYSIILDSHKLNDRTILTYKGINNDLGYREVGKINTKWFYFSSMLGKSFQTQKILAEYARKKGIKISYNISMYLAKKGISYIKPILKNCSIFTLNKEEIIELTREKDLLKAIKKIYSVTKGIVCVTDDGREINLYDGKYLYSAQPNKIKIIEKTGAGDAFASGLTSSIIKGMNIEDSINIALLNSESVIRYMGAKNKLLTWKDAIKLYKTHKVKVTRKCL